jgi:hypothetical protein
MGFVAKLLSLAAFRPVRTLLTGALIVAATGVQAVPYRLDYTGTFNSTESLNPASAASPTFFSATTPFT